MVSKENKLSLVRSLLMILAAAGLALAGWFLLRDGVGGRISGQMVDAAGRPLAGVGIQVEDQGITDISKADGTFMLNDLSPGDHMVEFHTPWQAGLRISVRVERLWRTRLGEIVIPGPDPGD